MYLVVPVVCCCVARESGMQVIDWHVVAEENVIVNNTNCVLVT